MQRHPELKTENALSTLKEDDPYLDGDHEDLAAALEVEATRSRHLPGQHLVLGQVAMVVDSEVASKAVAAVGSVADSEATEAIEVGLVAEEVLVTTEVIEVIEAAEEDSVAAHLLMLPVVREEEVDLEAKMIDAMATGVVGMAVDATEGVQAATETP